jgi:hypothetical protein
MGSDQKTQLRDGIMEIRLEHADSAVLRFVDGVSAFLGLRRDGLVRCTPVFLPASLLHDAPRRRDAAEDAVERIAEAFSDHEAWDSHHASHAPSAYRFATAAASWMYLLVHHYGSTIPTSCALFSEAVGAAVAESLTTKTARPISDAVARSQALPQP